MPSVLSDQDKETVKRTVPKPGNKIQAVGVVRLYIAYPNRQRWTYTGLQGAAVLANDLIGNTYWIKLVDVSPSNRGVIWDQEIYDTFIYNQDRTFFHSFELENCLAGLSFVDEKEAKTFKKKMDDREKNASKATKSTPFQGTSGLSYSGTNGSQEKHHGRLGNLLHGHRPSHHSAPPPTQSFLPPAGAQAPPPPPPVSQSASAGFESIDPSWRETLSELLELGITEDQIEQHADFIKSYIEQKEAVKAQEAATTNGGYDIDRRVKAPPPPPPAGGPPIRADSITPQHTGSTIASRRGPPPAPPPPRNRRSEAPSIPSPPRQSTPPAESPERTPSPPRPRFRAPPPLAEAGKFAGSNAPPPPTRNRAVSGAANPGPPPPPRPGKAPVEEEEAPAPKSRFGVPPPFVGERSHLPPPPPYRTPGGPPPPPPRAIADTPSAPPHPTPPPRALPPALPPTLPPKVPGPPHFSSAPPPPPGRTPNAVPPLPPLPSVARPVPGIPSSNGPPAPPPPPPPPGGAFAPPAPPPPPPFGNAPPPPPPPPPGGPAPPPLPPGRDSAPSAPPLPKLVGGGRDDLLSSIRGGARLKKVDDAEKNDRSAAPIPGAAAPTSPGGGKSPAPPSGGGGLADALAQALHARNKKVSASDDEDDNEDW